MTPVKAIRAKCLDCSGGSAKEVKECPVIACALHPFRLGRNPNRKPLSVERKAQLSERFSQRRMT